MGIIVQKFGGTSVGNGERMQNAAGIIERTLTKNPVIAVVSAMSGTTKSEGTTSLLIAAADAARKGAPFARELEMIEQNHFKALGDSVRDGAIRDEAKQYVTDELARLRSFLEAISVIRELSPRSQDNVLAVGEKLSARILTAVLNDRGVKAVFTDLAYVISDEETSVNPAFFRRLQGQLGERCRPRNGEVPVVTGFFGMVPGGLLAAVGRGYTDFTTAMIAAGLGREVVDELQVWKEVDGIFTADPRKVPSARVLSSISPAEAAELTYFGSEVLHPFTMERVVSANVPIRIKNSFRPEAAGTVIVASPAERAGRVTAVTVKRGITVLTITSNRMYNAYGFLSRVFNALADYGVVVDLVSTSEVSISCTVERLAEPEKVRTALGEFGTVELTPGHAILAIVGEGMKLATGTAGKLFSTLGAAGVNIEMISQGASEINISCVVKEEQAVAGLNAVHDAFFAAA